MHVKEELLLPELPEAGPERACRSNRSYDKLLELAARIQDISATGAEAATSTALQLVCDLTPGVSWASLTRGGDHPKTTAASAELAAALDSVQYELGQGPCLAAIDSEDAVVCELDRDHRWPEFSRLASAQTPVQLTISHPLAAIGHPGLGLNLYLEDAGVACAALARSRWTAAGFGLVLTAVEQRAKVAQLNVALETSRQIGAAIGILMHTHRITDEQAFALLRSCSQNTHRKLRDVAADVVFTGLLPPS